MRLDGRAFVLSINFASTSERHSGNSRGKNQEVGESLQCEHTCVLMDGLSFFSINFASISERHSSISRVPSLSVAPKSLSLASLSEDIFQLIDFILQPVYMLLLITTAETCVHILGHSCSGCCMSGRQTLCPAQWLLYDWSSDTVSCTVGVV